MKTGGAKNGVYQKKGIPAGNVDEKSEGKAVGDQGLFSRSKGFVERTLG